VAPHLLVIHQTFQSVGIFTYDNFTYNNNTTTLDMGDITYNGISYN